MGVYEMVVAIVFITCIASLLKARIKSRAPASLDPEIEQKLRKLEELEKRVQVLERVVTDSSYDLKRQIDDLERVT